MAPKRKIPKFVPGKILEIPLKSGRFGYAQVQLKDDFAHLFNIFEPVFDDSQDPTEWKKELPIKTKVYVNHASARANNWKHVCILPLGEHAKHLPLRVYGPVSCRTFVDAEGNRETLPGQMFTDAELKKRGYVIKTLWLAEDIQQLLDEGKELVFGRRYS